MHRAKRAHDLAGADFDRAIQLEPRNAWAHYSKSALLADEMGLGKTLMTISALAWLLEPSHSVSTVRKAPDTRWSLG